MRYKAISKSIDKEDSYYIIWLQRIDGYGNVIGSGSFTGVQQSSKTAICPQCGEVKSKNAILCKKCCLNSSERAANISLKNTGKHSSKKGKTWEEYYGVKKAKYMKQKLRRKLKGRFQKTKGKSYFEIYGEEKAKEITEKFQNQRKGKGNSNWRGGKRSEEFNDEYGISLLEWNKLTTIVRKRDRYVCQHCGDVPSYEVHHIIPRRFEINNSLENLILLCKKCHTTLEHQTFRMMNNNENPFSLFYGNTKKDSSLHTYVIDIDNTIVSYEGDYSLAKPFQNRIIFFNELYEKGNRIIYWTARGYTTGIDWRELTLKQFEKFNVKFHSLRFGKIDGSFYIDDKAINISDLNL